MAVVVPVPNTAIPTTYDVSTTRVTAVTTKNATDTSFATSSRSRPTGRISR